MLLVIKNKDKNSIYVSQNTFKRHIYLLLIREEGKRYNVLIKDINSFMYNHKLHCGRKKIEKNCYSLETFSKAEILNNHVNNCCIINSKIIIKMVKKEDVRLKIKKQKNKIL